MIRIAIAAVLTAFIASACYESGQSSTDARETEHGEPVGDLEIDMGDMDAEPDIRPDVPDSDLPPDIDCDQTTCIDCECECPDGTLQSWSECASICAPTPVCPDSCPPGMCTECTVPPPCPEGPPDGPIGGPCTGDSDCDLGASCYAESMESFQGELYVSWPGGTCVRYGSGNEGCDPMEPETCPEGSVCIFLGEYMAREWYGCFDACTPADSSDTPYDWACGCREDYACNLAAGACFPGCSNDRECCEFWNDENSDGRRQIDEVIFFPECEGYCDNEMGYDCKASYKCIHPGDEEARTGDPCEHDYQCMPGGMCLSSLYTDPDTGEPYYPGGYCTISDCQYRGRECTPYGGVCADFGGEGYRTTMCVTPCDVGTSPETPGYKCRSAPLEEAQACMPTWSSTFLEDPPDGEDGYCWYGNFPGGSKGLGEECGAGAECESPLGLGSCMEWFGDPAFCTISCNENLVHEQLICGDVDTEGKATGVCTWNMCWQSCNDLESTPASNDCPGDEMACVPLYVAGTYTYVPEGAERPLGICMPRCPSDAWCQSYFGPSRSCNIETEACG